MAEPGILSSTALSARPTAVVDSAGNPYNPYYDQFYYGYYNYPYPPEEKFIGIIPWALRIIKFIIIGVFLLSTSAVTYATFYWAVMPGNYASRTLYYDYTGTMHYPHENLTSIIPTI